MEAREPVLDPCRFTIFRLDGHSFSRFVRTEKLKRPFDATFSGAMKATCVALFEEHRFHKAFVGSDEISLVWLPFSADQLTKGATLPFSGRTQKLVSLLAGLASVAFYKSFALERGAPPESLPHFDCRSFQVDTAEEAEEALSERQLFTLKNSRMMLAQAHFSHAELQGVSSAQAVELLRVKKGIDFNAEVDVFNRIGGVLSRVLRDKTTVVPDGARKGEVVTFTRSVLEWTYGMIPRPAAGAVACSASPPKSLGGAGSTVEPGSACGVDEGAAT